MSLDTYEVVIASETMLGDLMKFMVEEMKAAKDVWQKLSEQDQDDFLERCEKRCREAVEQVCTIVASQGNPALWAQVESVQFKGGIKAVLCPDSKSPLRHDLADSIGKEVLIVLSDYEGLINDEGKPKAEPDQPGLPLGDFGEAAIERDPLHHEAVAYVSGLKKAVSTSQLQRKLKIGYNRAARLLEALERDGAVGPMGNDGRYPISHGEAA